MLTDQDIFLFRQGNHCRLYEKLGSHPATCDGVEGTQFAVWAPNATTVSVVGDWNAWQADAHPMQARLDGSGVWEAFVPDAAAGHAYKYHLRSRYRDFEVQKGDPYAASWEMPPGTASRICALDHEWNDQDWMRERAQRNALSAPMSIYEIHLGSWRRVAEDGNRSLNYREIAVPLAEYVRDLGFTHVELLPVTEHPFFGSWGYQTTGYFAPTARYGTPQDFMYLVDTLHRYGIGVILDWVPSHFPNDEHGLVYFDGTHLYEHEDARQGFHPEWKSHIFNYGRNEVRAFLLSSALFWLEKYHIDGLRVDAVASMLYLDYSREEGEWIPNAHGGRENLDAMHFLRSLNEAVYREHPDVQVIAEESTSWPMVSRPTYLGGLGFGMKWNMGWMHDTLGYLAEDPIYRRYHHDRLTFSIWYAFFENFVLPLSHDEVVHGKGSLIGKLPGDEWQQFANLRLLFGYMWTHPGKKLLFMGGEFGQKREWQHDESLEWQVLEYPLHAGVQRWVKDLNSVYRWDPALHERDFDNGGFEWVDCHDANQSVLSYLRLAQNGELVTLTVLNFTPVPRTNYIVGVPRAGYWREVLNSDAPVYGGSGMSNLGGVEASPNPSHGRYHSLALTVPPLAAIVLKWDGVVR